MFINVFLFDYFYIWFQFLFVSFHLILIKTYPGRFPAQTKAAVDP